MRIIGFLLMECGFKNSPKIYQLVFTFLSLDSTAERTFFTDVLTIDLWACFNSYLLLFCLALLSADFEFAIFL